MTTRLDKPVVREVPIRFLNHVIRDYVIEVNTAGVRLRKKGSRTWYGPAAWGSILNCAARVTAPAREVEVEKTARRRA